MGSFTFCIQVEVVEPRRF